MSKERKSGKMRSIISSLFGIKEWKLKADGHLDISEEDLNKLTREYGKEFVAKFEKLLKEEAGGDRQPATAKEEITINSNTDMYKPDFVCKVLGLESLTLADNMTTLSKEQLDKIEARLKELDGAKTAAESTLATANSAKDKAEADLKTANTAKADAESKLTETLNALDELDNSVKEAKDAKAKVEAVRKKLAAKPGAGATGIQRNGDNNNRPKIENADPVTDYAASVL